MDKIIESLKFSFAYDENAKLSFGTKDFMIMFLIFYGIYCIKFSTVQKFIKNNRYTTNIYNRFIAFWQRFTNAQESFEDKLPHYFRIGYVVVFSLFFYYKSSGMYFILLIISSIVDYFLANYIYKINCQSDKKAALILSICINLGLLMYFKYTNFFLENINNLTGSNIGPWEIFLPVGISFYTFQTMSYTIDVYRGNLKPTNSFLDFLFFVSFFPQLVAGPIVRASQFIPQITRKPKVNNYHIDKALLLIMGGIIKKFIISDYIGGNFVDRVFENPEKYSGFENLLGSYGYTIQIYCDFSAYSDMAIAIALLMGFKLPTNFRSPYQSTSITEFWRRWHISLSSWLRDYLYISLGGNRKGKIRTYVNLFLVMFFGGLWHGASWMFLLWGILHGVMLAIERFFKQYIKLPKNFAVTFIKWFLTLHFVIFCWIFFRADSFEKAILIIKNIGNAFTENIDITKRIIEYKYIIGLIVFAFITHLTPDKYFFNAYKFYKKTDINIKVVMFGLLIWIAYLFMGTGVRPFIYFQF